MARMPGPVTMTDRAGYAIWTALGQHESGAVRESATPETRGSLVSRWKAVSATLGRVARGQVSPRLMATCFVPAACISFVGGILMAALHLPRGFDIGMCVLSRLCSRYHNPDGHGFLTFGMLALPAFLVPLPGFLSRRLGGCPRLTAWGRAMLSIGLAATALVGAERAWCPTHWTPMENAHLILAGVAFGGLWLGLAMLVGAPVTCDGVRVRWQWLRQPPWYLAASILPIVVLFAIYVPFRTVPQAHSSLLAMWPRPLIFLRAVSFWQGYLVAGLVFSLIGATARACREAGAVPVRAGRVGLSRTRRGSIVYQDRRHSTAPPPHRRRRDLVAEAHVDR